MSLPLALGIALAAGYLVGSLPFGLLIGRYVAGVDIRKSGSGNIGATNVARVLGKRLGLIVLILDCLKGALPTLLLPFCLADSDPSKQHIAVLSGTAAIIGHMFPCWLKFKGGKGVATALGVALALAPLATGAAFLVFALSVALTRIVSLSSVLAACSFCGIELWLLRPSPFGEATWSLATFSTLVPLLIVFRHRSNLARLMRGAEPKFQFGGKTQAATEPQKAEPPVEPSGINPQ